MEENKYNFIYKACSKLCHVFCSQYFDFEIHNKHYIPKNGPFLIAANHRSFLDPPLAGLSVESDLYFFARKTLFKKGFWSWLFKHLNCIPVDTKSDNNVNSLKKVFEILNKGGSLVVFPEGTRSPNGNFLPAKAGVGMMACRSQVPVVPVHIYGAYEAWPRQSFFAKFNKQIRIVYGKPLMPEDYDPGKTDKGRYQKAAVTILDTIKELQVPVENEI